MHDLSCERQAGVCGAGVFVIFNAGGADLRETAAAEIQDTTQSHLRIIGNGRAAAARAAGIADFTAGTGVAVVASGAITRLGIADGRAGGIAGIADIFSGPLALCFTAALADLSQVVWVGRTTNTAGIFGDGACHITGDGSGL